MDAVGRYLMIPAGYAFPAGRLWWSESEDAVECGPDSASRATFALRPQIADFLEGFASRAGLIPFPYVLQLLSLLGRGPGTLPLATVALRRAFRAAGAPTRPAGAFCARLCEGVPRAPATPPAAEVCARLRSPGRLFVVNVLGRAEVPPLPPAEFERIVLEALARFDPADLPGWLARDAEPPERAAEPVAEAAEEFVARPLAEIIDDALARPGLAGVRAHVDRLVAAVAIPPRRLEAARLPLGGFSGLDTRGHPDNLLPWQFALDEWEFLRRFAERELLYFRREEPQRRIEADLTVVLDQGVRTWGGVRLALAAAAAALAKGADRRGVGLRLACTSRAGTAEDAATLRPGTLAEILSAADLSPNPAEALSAELETADGSAAGRPPRDIVVLSHRRSLAEPAVARLLRPQGGGDRVFTVGLDATGTIEFCEHSRAGGSVRLAQFRLDLALGESAAESAVAKDDADRTDPAVWKGDVEPVPYPFRIGFGPPAGERRVAFGCDGKVAIALSREGVPHVLPLAPGYREGLLPRPVLDGKHVLTQPSALFGTADGFVLAGRLAGRDVAAHYNLTTRACRLYVMSDSTESRAGTWRYNRTRHLVLYPATVGSEGRPDFTAIHLATGMTAPASVVIYRESIESPTAVNVIFDDDTTSGPEWFWVDRRKGLLGRHSPVGQVRTFTPRTEGKPMLADPKIGAALAIREGDVAAILFTGVPGWDAGNSAHPMGVLMVVDFGAEPKVLSTTSVPLQLGFALSPDGRRLALQRGSELAVYEAGSTAAPVASMSRAKSHQDGGVYGKSPGCLIYQAGNRRRNVQWASGALTVSDTTEYGTAASWTAGLRQPGPERFRKPRLEFGRLKVAVDSSGHCAVFDRNDSLVCLFFAFRDKFAAWMPDGTRYGSPDLLYGPPTPSADRRIAAALLRAEGTAPEGKP